MRFGEGYVTFCDDVRFENNGKEILIGVYAGNCQCPGTPETFAMPSLGIVSTSYIDPDECAETPPRLLIFFPHQEDPAIAMDLEVKPEVTMGDAPELDELSTFGKPPVTLRSVAVIRNLKFKGSGFIRVVLEYCGKMYLQGRLQVIFSESEEGSSAAPLTPQETTS